MTADEVTTFIQLLSTWFGIPVSEFHQVRLDASNTIFFMQQRIHLILTIEDKSFAFYTSALPTETDYPDW